jgi:hypothetical protein
VVRPDCPATHREQAAFGGAILTKDLKQTKSRRPETWAGLLILVSTMLRLFLAWVTQPLGDEAYHWLLGSHFHLSYFDHSPLAYWMTALSSWLGVRGGFVCARLPFILLFSGSTWMMFLIGRRLFGGWAGFYAALLLNSSAYFVIGAGVCALPEGPLVFFWLICVWFLTRIFFDPDLRRPLWWWLGLGMLLGLAFLSKSHSLFIPFGAGLAVLTQRGLRRWAWSAGPYLALAVAVIVSLPVFVWNMEHEWISFAYQFGRGMRFREIEPEAVLKSLAGQSLLYMPWLWFFLVCELARGFIKGPRSQIGWFLSLMAAGPIVVFTLFSVFNSEWYQCHWQAVGYLTLFPALGVRSAALMEKGVARVRWGLAFSIVAILTTCGLIALYAAVTTSEYMPPPFASVAPNPAVACNYDLSGYAGLGEALERKGVLNDSNLFVFTSHYMDSGRVGWVLRGRCPVLCFAPEDGAKSYPFVERPSGWPGANGLAVSRSQDVTADLALFEPYFKRMTPLGSVKVGRGFHQTILFLHLFEEMTRPFAFPYGPRIQAWGGK